MGDSVVFLTLQNHSDTMGAEDASLSDKFCRVFARISVALLAGG
jgi:hypothetical protein